MLGTFGPPAPRPRTASAPPPCVQQLPDEASRHRQRNITRLMFARTLRDILGSSQTELQLLLLQTASPSLRSSRARGRLWINTRQLFFRPEFLDFRREHA